MVDQSLKILLVYETPDGRKQIEEVLRTSDFDELRLEFVSAKQIIEYGSRHHRHDVCLLETVGTGSAPLIHTLKAALSCPIIALTWDSGSEVLSALHCGASDCLIRNQLTAATLEESICAAVEDARSQTMLTQYERWYLSLLENSSDLIFTQDLDGNFSSINRAVEKLTGYTQDEIIGMNFTEIVAPEYCDLVWRSTLLMLDDRRPVSRQVAIISKHWQRIPVHMTTHLVYQYGAPIGVQGVMRALGRLLLRAGGLNPTSVQAL